MTWNPFAPPPQPPAGAGASPLPPGWSSEPFAGTARHAVHVVTDHPAFGEDRRTREPEPYEVEAEIRTEREREAAARRKNRRGFVSPREAAATAATRRHGVIAALQDLVLDEVGDAGEALVDLSRRADRDSTRFRAAAKLVEMLDLSGRFMNRAEFGGLLNSLPVADAVKELTRAVAAGEIAVEEADQFRKLLETRAGLAEVADLQEQVNRLNATLSAALSRLGGAKPPRR